MGRKVVSLDSRLAAMVVTVAVESNTICNVPFSSRVCLGPCATWVSAQDAVDSVLEGYGFQLGPVVFEVGKQAGQCWA